MEKKTIVTQVIYFNYTNWIYMFALKVKYIFLYRISSFFCCTQYECIFAKSAVCRPACLTPAFTQKGFVTDSQEIEFPSEQGNKQKITPAVN